MKIRILAVGRQKPSPTLDLCEEYLKRMKWTVTLKEVDAGKAATARAEAALLLPEIKKPCFAVALDERGDTLGSEAFAARLQDWHGRLPSGGEVVFIIGGADGLSDEIRKNADFRLSFGKQTWPHMLVRVMLLEQIYRAQQITAGHPYHRP